MAGGRTPRPRKRADCSPGGDRLTYLGARRKDFAHCALRMLPFGGMVPSIPREGLRSGRDGKAGSAHTCCGLTGAGCGDMTKLKVLAVLGAAWLAGCGGGSGSGSDASWWKPAVTDTWQWQLKDTINTGYDVS